MKLGGLIRFFQVNRFRREILLVLLIKASMLAMLYIFFLPLPPR